MIRAAVIDIRTESHRTEYGYLASHPEALRREESAFAKKASPLLK